eukprot:COSAG02_NODE_575_length_20117_cov_5.801139_14_plen_57_part_00
MSVGDGDAYGKSLRMGREPGGMNVSVCLCVTAFVSRSRCSYLFPTRSPKRQCGESL